MNKRYGLTLLYTIHESRRQRQRHRQRHRHHQRHRHRRPVCFPKGHISISIGYCLFVCEWHVFRI